MRRGPFVSVPGRLARDIAFPLVRAMAAVGAHTTSGCRPQWCAGSLPPRGYDKWFKAPVSQWSSDDAHVIDAIRDLHGDEATSGYRLVADGLAGAGVPAEENRIWRPCSVPGVSASPHRRRGSPGEPALLKFEMIYATADAT